MLVVRLAVAAVGLTLTESHESKPQGCKHGVDPNGFLFKGVSKRPSYKT